MAEADRTEVSSDTFDSSIDSDWDNPAGDEVGALGHVGGGEVEPDTNDELASMRQNTGTYDGDHYGQVTIGGNHGSGGSNFAWLGGTVRHASGATDDTHYSSEFVASNSVISVGYRLGEFATDGSRTVIATAGSDHDGASGDTVTLEVVGSDLEIYTEEGAGGDTLKLGPHSDTTLTGGRPGCHAQKQTAGDAQITAWSGGDVAVAGGNAPQLMMMGVGN